MKLRTLDDVKTLRGKRVLLRADFNVPVTSGKVSADEDWRIRKVVPSIAVSTSSPMQSESFSTV